MNDVNQPTSPRPEPSRSSLSGLERDPLHPLVPLFAYLAPLVFMPDNIEQALKRISQAPWQGTLPQVVSASVAWLCTLVILAGIALSVLEARTWVLLKRRALACGRILKWSLRNDAPVRPRLWWFQSLTFFGCSLLAIEESLWLFHGSGTSTAASSCPNSFLAGIFMWLSGGLFVGACWLAASAHARGNRGAFIETTQATA